MTRIAAATALVAMMFLVTPLTQAGATAKACSPTQGQQHGIDVSTYQGSISFAEVATTSVRFVYARISNGTIRDTSYATNKADATAAHLEFGAYEEFQPGENPVAQAKILIDDGNLAGGNLVPAVGVFTTGGQTATVLLANLRTWLTTVQNALGVKPLIMTDKTFWLGSHIGGELAAKGYQLWVDNPGGSALAAVPPQWLNVTPRWRLFLYSDTGTATEAGNQQFVVADPDGYLWRPFRDLGLRASTQ
jgi:GH25 family lysozyme M1 (1,4-beta-N-acetylmuramidase)